MFERRRYRTSRAGGTGSCGARGTGGFGADCSCGVGGTRLSDSDCSFGVGRAGSSDTCYGVSSRCSKSLSASRTQHARNGRDPTSWLQGRNRGACSGARNRTRATRRASRSSAERSVPALQLGASACRAREHARQLGPGSRSHSGRLILCWLDLSTSAGRRSAADGNRAAACRADLHRGHRLVASARTRAN